jgi:hypothetical protein
MEKCMRINARKLCISNLIAVLGLGGCGVSGTTSTGGSGTTTPLGYGTYQDIIAGVNQQDNQVWWAIHDPNGKEHLYLSFNTTPSLGLPGPILLYMGINPQGYWFGGTMPITPGYTIVQNAGGIDSPLASVDWNASTTQYTIAVKVPNVLTANLKLSGPVGGATLPADWDAETSYWIQSLGTGTANGTISFPQINSSDTVTQGNHYPTTVTNWGAEQESQFGNFQLGSELDTGAAIHVGYDYASTYNPDGSTDTLYTFPLLKGGWHGIMTTTFADGTVSQCADPVPTESNWYADSGGFSYPLELSVSCNGRSLVFTTSTAQTNSLSYSTVEVDGFMAASSNATSNQGGVGLIQHIRDAGYFGVTP